jgi:hypothetical protein
LINAKHPIYEHHAPQWQRCRDAYMGDEAIKSRGTAYLPKPSGMKDNEYKAYLTRALYYETVGRTIDGFVGAISRVDPVVNVPARLEPMVRNATLDGLTFAELSKLLCGENLLQGRGGLLVDWNEKTQMPYLAFYPVESITNWSDDRVILQETVYEADPDDKFKQIAIDQYRELSVEGGVYVANIWRRGGSEIGSEFYIHETHTPSRRGVYLSKLPFVWLSTFGNSERVEAPPLLGLVNVSLSHFRNSADHEHGLHYSGLPTLVVTGASDQEQEIRVGSMSAIMLTDVNAKVYYAEFSGQGLKSIENALAAKERQMAVLGATAFDNGPNGVEAAETARIRTSGQTSLLMGVTTSVEATLQIAMSLAAWWAGAEGPVEITLNRDFSDIRLDGQTLTALVAAYQSGALSLSQFLHNLKQGQMLKPDTNIEAEVKAIRAAKRVPAPATEHIR